MGPLGLLSAIIIGIIIYFAKNGDRHRYIKTYVKEVESDESKTQLSKHPTANFSFEKDHADLACINLTPRILVEVPDSNYSYTLRAIKDQAPIGFSVSIGKQKVELITSLGKTIRAQPVEINSNNKESDLMLQTLLELWGIEKKGRPRMKQTILLFAEKFEMGYDSYKRHIKFLAYYYNAELETTISFFLFDIDWHNGIAKIKEISSENRARIIDSFMV